jgi:hypothetical protein
VTIPTTSTEPKLFPNVDRNEVRDSTRMDMIIH